jgi:hypothetical protein
MQIGTKMRCYINEKSLPNELKKGIAQLAEEFSIELKDEKSGVEIVFVESGSPEKGFEIENTGGAVCVKYSGLNGAFRGLARMLAGNTETASEKTFLDTLGFMIDCSRNAVMTVDTAKAVLRRMALMGYNMMMLYTENTYEVPGEPFFGYLRGAYTKCEMKEIDDYAHNLGIELVPCMQTIGHMEQSLQWEAFGDVRDTEYTLLPREQKTYELIAKMLDAAMAPVRTKRIHIGMDEARMLGSGAFKSKHGEIDNLELMVEHMERVWDMCVERGLKPMIWSDCFFRRGKTFEGYYDVNAPLPVDLLERIPRDMQMVHWDYWHYDEKDYSEYIDLHRKHGREPIIAPGAVASGRFWCAMEHSFKAFVPCVDACREKDVKEMLLTTWGDDGAEVDFISTLAAAQLLAELSFNERLDEDNLSDNFSAVCGADFNAYRKAAHIDLLPSQANEEYPNANCSKWLLWDDPMLGICEPYHADERLSEHYSRLAEELFESAKSGTYGSKRLLLPAQIAKVLSIKADLRKDIVEAYKSGEREKLSGICNDLLPELIEDTEKLWRIHRNAWLSTNKLFGLEVVEKRYGGLIARLKTLRERLKMFLDGGISSLPEFETELYKFRSKPSRSFMSPLLLKAYGPISTASAQK